MDVKECNANMTIFIFKTITQFGRLDYKPVNKAAQFLLVDDAKSISEERFKEAKKHGLEMKVV